MFDVEKTTALDITQCESHYKLLQRVTSIADRNKDLLENVIDFGKCKGTSILYFGFQ